MTATKPISRVESLQPLSREHHEGLLFCWKLRHGLGQRIPFERIKSYADWFFKTHLENHFAVEEKYIFPLLGMDHGFVKEAMKQHQRLKELFLNEIHPERTLPMIAEELHKHIRFEERILFNEIQETLPGAELDKLEGLSSVNAAEAWEDEFWI